VLGSVFGAQPDLEADRECRGKLGKELATPVPAHDRAGEATGGPLSSAGRKGIRKRSTSVGVPGVTLKQLLVR
jgi:hypothetical protein